MARQILTRLQTGLIEEATVVMPLPASQRKFMHNSRYLQGVYVFTHCLEEGLVKQVNSLEKGDRRGFPMNV